MKKRIRLTLIGLFLLPFLGLNAKELNYGDSLATVHKNEVMGYFQFGKNILNSYYGGFTGFYKRNFGKRVEVIGGLNLSTKNPNGFGGVSGEVLYRIPIGNANLKFTNKAMYNYYGQSEMNEFVDRIAAIWQTRYVELIFGNSFLTYWSLGSSVFEPVTLTIGMSANLKPIENPWNVSMFIRNYDDFFVENFNINFGIKGYYDLLPQWRTFAELMVRPAGSMNQLAVKYETAFKFGVKYKW